MTPEEALRILLRSDRSFASLPFAGAGGSDSGGLLFGFHPEEWFWAKITEQPEEGTPYKGYSWKKVIPQLNGAFADPDPDLESTLTGDNGRTTTDRRNQGFSVDGSTTIPVDTIVIMVRGYQAVGETEDIYPGQQYLFIAPGAASVCPDQTCPDGSTATDDCELVIVGTTCDEGGATRTRTTRRISIRSGKFHICTTTESLPVPPCPTQDLTGAFLLMGA